MFVHRNNYRQSFVDPFIILDKKIFMAVWQIYIYVMYKFHDNHKMIATDGGILAMHCVNAHVIKYIFPDSYNVIGSLFTKISLSAIYSTV